MLLAPVVVGSERVGSLGFTCANERSWSGSEVEALETAARILGAAFARGRMEEALWQSEERFRQTQKMEAIGQLAGGIAHDFNNLLTVISGHASAFPRFVLSPEAQLAASEILAASQRAAALTRQLLVFSRGQVLHPENVEANAIVGGVVQMLRRVIAEHISIEVELEAQPIPVYVDPAQLEQILLNLIVNARDAMPHGGAITIRVGRRKASESPVELARDECVLISVSDTGLGMSEETKARIFEPFFTTKEPGAGTGLGLSTVYGIVHQSGGAIEVESSPGAGSTFNVFLPIGSGSVEPAAPVAAGEAPSAPGTVMVVEDDSAVRKLAAEILARAGHEVREAENGVLALESLAEEAGVDVVLTDIVMPAMSGWELGDAIRLRYPEMRVLYMSGYPRRELDLPTTADLIQKPFSAVELCERVAAAVAEVRGRTR